MAARKQAPRQPTPRSADRTFFAHDSIEEWLQGHRGSRGMYARKWGKSVILGRKEVAPDDEVVLDDRLKITRESAQRYSLQAKDHKGRWMRVDQFSDLHDLLGFIRRSLPHYLKAYSFNRAAEGRERTSGEQH